MSGIGSGLYTLTVPIEAIDDMLAGAGDTLVPLSFVDAVRAFHDQAARGESENPTRYADTYLALDDELRRLSAALPDEKTR